MMNKNFYLSLEKKLISSKNRFKLQAKDLIELKSIFKDKTLLIAGSAGSIGSQIVLDFYKYRFSPKKIYLLDKNENQLTDLNRKILLQKKKISVEFICTDLVTFDLDRFIRDNKIKIYLNCAAVKHVRSEENIYSINYMLKTNSFNFLPKNKHNLEKVFSVSTDKTVNPTSVLGISKNLMEKMLIKFSKKKVFVSTARFANVSFSNGSILKYIVDKAKNLEPFGVPKKVRRFFITHSEASSLCFKALLKRNNKKIIIPNPSILKKDTLISDLTKKLLLILKVKYKFSEKKFKFKQNNRLIVYLSPSISDGQKFRETLISREEKILKDKDISVIKTELKTSKLQFLDLKKKLLKIKNIRVLKKNLKKFFTKYNPPKYYKSVSKYL